MTEKQQQQAAAKFAEEWIGKGYEKGESQPFWMALLHNVYGVEHAEKYKKSDYGKYLFKVADMVEED